MTGDFGPWEGSVSATLYCHRTRGQRNTMGAGISIIELCVFGIKKRFYIIDW